MIPDRTPERRIEIVHESLLTKWPRLVRWRAQDVEGAQLRDELRQAAQLWEQHGRAEDFLWTGMAYREFQLWRERYPGGLTELEETFAGAMTSLALRRRRRRRAGLLAAFLLLVAVLGVVGSLLRTSRRQTRLARTEALRAEAAHLLSLAQLELDTYPTAAVAYATAALELSDSHAARRLALEALWRGPTAWIVAGESTPSLRFSGDGRYLVRTVQGYPGQVSIEGSDGASRRLPERHKTEMLSVVTIPESDLFSTGNSRELVLWSLPEGEPVLEASFADKREQGLRIAGWTLDPDLERIHLLYHEQGGVRVEALRFDGTTETLGRIAIGDGPDESGTPSYLAALDEWHRGSRLALASRRAVSMVEVGDHELGSTRTLGTPPDRVTRLIFDPLGRFLVTASDEAEVRLWPLGGHRPPRALRDTPGAIHPGLRMSHDGSLLEVPRLDRDRRRSRIWTDLESDHPRVVREIDYGPRTSSESWLGGWSADASRIANGGPDGLVRLWSLSAPADAEPLLLRRGPVGYSFALAFHPGGSWLATGDSGGVLLWPLRQPFPEVIRRQGEGVASVVFDPQGRWVASAGGDSTLRLWPLEGKYPEPGRILVDEFRGEHSRLAVSPDGTHLLLGTNGGSLPMWVPVEGGAPSTPAGDLGLWPGVAVSSDGRFAAGVGREVGGRSEGARAIVWETSTWSEVAEISIPNERVMASDPCFLPDGRLLLSTDSGLWRVDPSTGASERLVEGFSYCGSVSADGRRVAVVTDSELSWEAEGYVVLLDLDDGSTARLDSHGDRVYDVALDPTGTFVVSGDKDGVLRVGPVTGEEPHLMLGHEGWIWSVALDPVHRRIASAGADGTIRIWPMPDLSKPPLHTFPRDELLAKLRSLTNLRAVRDEASPTGWKVEAGPFPGWEAVPTW